MIYKSIFNKKHKIRTRLMWITIPLGIVSLIILEIISFKFASRELTNMIKKIGIKNTKTITNKIDEKFEECVNDLKLLSEIKIFYDYTQYYSYELYNEANIVKSEIKNLFSNMILRKDFYNAIIFVDITGLNRIEITKNNNHYISNIKYQNFLNKLIISNNNTSIDFTTVQYTANTKNNSSIYLGQKVKYENKLLGYLIIEFNLNAITNILLNNSIAEKGQFLLVDNENNIISSNNYGENLWQQVKQNPNIKNLLLTVHNNLRLEDVDNFIIVYSKYHEWSLIGIFNKHLITSGIKNLKYYGLLIVIIFLLIKIFFVVILIRVIVDPIEKLSRTARNIEINNLTPIKIDQMPSNEVGELAESMNLMLNNILNYQQELKNKILELENNKNEISHLNAELEQKVEERTAQLKESYKKVEDAFNHLKSTQSQLVLSEKMASIGVLAAGMAHEINNPVNFITASIVPLKRDLKTIIDHYENNQNMTEQEYKANREEIDKLLMCITNGALRINKIVTGISTFSRNDSLHPEFYDINKAVENALTLTHNEYKNKIEIIKDLSNLPMTKVNVSQINQVILNILMNAFQAVENDGKVWIKTTKENGHIKISIKDNGPGIQDDMKDKIFDPFFTTKPVGKGTGLGLSISYNIIKDHGGRIVVNSKEKHGAEFIINLPINMGEING